MNTSLNLEQSTPRLFAAGYRADFAAHQQTFDDLPAFNPASLLQQIEDAGLDGRGGAGFALFRKLVSTERGRHALVIANGAEGESLSYKDRMLLEHAPHLVLDGLQIAGALVGSGNLYLYARGESLAAMGQLATARGINVVQAPGTFVSGEASAAANAVLTGLAKPMNHVQHLNRAEKQGTHLLAKTRGPALVQNVETLAHLALIARYGAAWFRSTGGTGTRLFTVHDRRAGSASVLELADGVSLGAVARRAGISLDATPATLIGGFHGRWALPGDVSQPLSAERLNPAAGIIYPLLPEECVLSEASGMINFLARESAGQCGPCTNGLPELAQTFARLVTTSGSTADLRAEIDRLATLIEGRGMCKHPDATVRFAHRTLLTFAREAEYHAAGHCSREALLATA